MEAPSFKSYSHLFYLVNFGFASIRCLVFAGQHRLLYQRQTSIFLPKWITQGDIDCCIKIAPTFSIITIASVHSLRSLGQIYGRISLRSRAAPINLPSMRGVIRRLY